MKLTQALSELHTISKRIETTKERVLTNLTRIESADDPHKGEPDGSFGVNARHLESIADLEKRYELIRVAIMKANIENGITIKNTTKSIFGWLVWKRDIYDGLYERYKTMVRSVRRAHLDNQSRPQTIMVKDANGVESPQMLQIIDHVNLKKIEDRLSEIEEIYNILDGELSLKNAEIVIEVN